MTETGLSKYHALVPHSWGLVDVRLHFSSPDKRITGPPGGKHLVILGNETLKGHGAFSGLLLKQES